MEITFENIKYQLDTDKKTAVVTGYQDNPVEVIIPEYVEYENEKYKVTEIEEKTFYWCDSLTSITIPNSVTSIERETFYNCSSLTSITIPDSVTEIGYMAFAFCKSLTSITIPDSVSYIGICAFKHSSLKEVRIPKNCTEFDGFDATVNVIIDENNLYYFKYQDFIFKFIDDENISLIRYQGDDSEVQIPEIVNYKEKDYKVIEIGNHGFEYRVSLQSITIPNSVTKIGLFAFNRIGLTLPKRYTEDGNLIAYKAFSNNMTCRDFQYEEGKSYEIKGKIELCECGFHACTNPLDIFNFYIGEIGKDIYIHEVYLSGTIDEDNEFVIDSKVCASKIEIGRRLTIKDINEIINSK